MLVRIGQLMEGSGVLPTTKFVYFIGLGICDVLSCMSEFGRVCGRRKLRVNVGKSKVMRCFRYGNGDRMHVILKGEPLEEVD